MFSRKVRRLRLFKPRLGIVQRISYFLDDLFPKFRKSAVDIGTETAHYKPMFGAGDSESRIVKGIARHGQLTVEPAGSSEIVSYPDEEQIYFILEGTGLVQYGDQKVPVKKTISCICR